MSHVALFERIDNMNLRSVPGTCREIANDWIGVYKKYFRTNSPVRPAAVSLLPRCDIAALPAATGASTDAGRTLTTVPPSWMLMPANSMRALTKVNF